MNVDVPAASNVLIFFKLKGTRVWINTTFRAVSLEATSAGQAVARLVLHNLWVNGSISPVKFVD